MTDTGMVTKQVESRHHGLAVCWIIYGILRLAVAVWLVGFVPVATRMFGTLLNEVAHPDILMADFHVLYFLAILLSALSGLAGLVAGLTMLNGHRRGSTLAVVAAFLSLSELPVGLTLGVYTLWVLPAARRVNS
jgi:hypothetical protein